MRIYSFFLMMLAALSLTSCSSDEDSEFDADCLSGRWLEVYDDGVVSEGLVYYTFEPIDATSGNCIIYSYDVFAVDTTYQRGYILEKEERRISIFNNQYGGVPDSQTWNILKLNNSHLSWSLEGRPDIVQNFEKVKTFFGNSEPDR